MTLFNKVAVCGPVSQWLQLKASVAIRACVTEIRKPQADANVIMMMRAWRAAATFKVHLKVLATHIISARSTRESVLPQRSVL